MRPSWQRKTVPRPQRRIRSRWRPRTDTPTTGCYYCSDLKSWANGFCDLYFDLQLTSYHCHACNSAHYDHIHFNCGRWAIAGDSPVELPTAPGGTIGDLDRQESAR